MRPQCISKFPDEKWKKVHDTIYKIGTYLFSLYFPGPCLTFIYIYSVCFFIFPCVPRLRGISFMSMGRFS